MFSLRWKSDHASRLPRPSTEITPPKSHRKTLFRLQTPPPRANRYQRLSTPPTPSKSPLLSSRTPSPSSESFDRHDTFSAESDESPTRIPSPTKPLQGSRTRKYATTIQPTAEGRSTAGSFVDAARPTFTTDVPTPSTDLSASRSLSTRQLPHRWLSRRRRSFEGPRQELPLLRVSRASEASSAPSADLESYYGLHVAEPCTKNSLIHLLTCGHKVVTGKPEDCARNCEHPPSPDSLHPNSIFPNVRSVDEVFECTRCVEKRDHEDKRFSRTLEELSDLFGSSPTLSVKDSRSFYSKRKQSNATLLSSLAVGRQCQAISGDPPADFVERPQSKRKGSQATLLDQDVQETIANLPRQLMLLTTVEAGLSAYDGDINAADAAETTNLIATTLKISEATSAAQSFTRTNSTPPSRRLVKGRSFALYQVIRQQAASTHKSVGAHPRSRRRSVFSETEDAEVLQ